MPKSNVHNAVIFRPPPGARFTLWGADIELQFPRGEEQYVYEYLHAWLEQYLLPEVIRAKNEPNPGIKNEPNTTVQAQDDIHAEIKIAAMNLKNETVKVTSNDDNKGFTPTTRMAIPVPTNGVPVVYGPNGPMTKEEIANLPHQPTGGYLSNPELPKLNSNSDNSQENS